MSQKPEIVEVSTNVDRLTVEGFGDEWRRFDQASLSENELKEVFEQYFKIFPWDALTPKSEGFDLGCGSGRWDQYVAPQVACLHCIDPSAVALDVAKRNLARFPNCRFHLAAIDGMPMVENSMDFGFSIGVLHAVPDPAAGIKACVSKLKPGAPFLLYLYYAFDNRPEWFRLLWHPTNIVRLVISRAPYRLRYALSQAIAAAVYFPLARFLLLLDRLGVNVKPMPLSAYKHSSFYMMRTDALDRFGTRLEKRFTASQIRAMMGQAGLEEIRFSDSAPYWCAVGYRKR